MSIILSNTHIKLITGVTVFIFLLVFITAFIRKSNIVMVNEVVPITNGNTERKVVAFACNVYEGEQVINRMIKILEDKQVKMSFFLGGIWVEKNSSLVKELYEKGYDLQNHGYYHKRPSTLNKQRHVSEIKDTEELIYNITGLRTNLFEPPYGDYDENTLNIVTSLDYRVVTWSIDTIDWREDATEDIIQNRIKKKLCPGAIILMHPKEVTANVLGKLIDYLEKEGYEIITVTEMINKY